MKAILLLGVLMVFSSSTQKVAGVPNLDTFVDDQDFGGSGDYSDYRPHDPYRPYDHRGEAALPESSHPSSDPHNSSLPDSYHTSRGGGVLDSAGTTTYDDEDNGAEDYGSGDYYDENYDEEYDQSVDVGGHAEEHLTTPTTTPLPPPTTTQPPPPPPTTTQPPPPPPPPVVEITTTSTTTTTTPPPTTTSSPPSTTSPPSSIIEENGIYTDEERERKRNGAGGAAGTAYPDYGYEDEGGDEEYEEYEDENYDLENGPVYDDEDYGGEGSGAGIIPGGHSEDATHHDQEDDTHHTEDPDVDAGRGVDDHFTFDKMPVEEAERDPHLHHTPDHEEPAPPHTDDEIWFQNNLTPGHTDPKPDEEKEVDIDLPDPAEKEEEEDHDSDLTYDYSDPYGRKPPVDTAVDGHSPGAGDDHYGSAGATNMDGSVQIVTHKEDDRQVSIFAQPGILAAFIGGAVVGLLCAILLVMFVVYRMRKKDEGSYPLDEPKRLPLTSSYATTDKEIYA